MTTNDDRRARLAAGTVTALALAFGLRASTANAGTQGAVAEQPPRGSAMTTPRVEAPRLLRSTEPAYPAGELGKGARVVVTLSLLVDVDGRVAESSVAESGGAAFDEAALAVVPSLVFTSATRDGVAVPARIPFRFVFDEPPPGPEATPAGRALRGVVTTQVGEPVRGARVIVLSASGERSTTTDAAGAFALENAAAGPARVRIESDGFAPLVADTTVDGDVDAAPPLSYVLAPAASTEIEVRGARATREPTVQTLERSEIRTMPGANGDPLRALESMPGLARAPFPGGMLIVRGSAPRDTWVSVDGTWIPLAYHFGGVASVVPGDVLERLDYRPGNFGPEHGRAMGGVVDMALRSPRKDRVGGLAQVDLLDGRLLVEGPLGERARFLVAGRRSWVDAWLGPVLRSSGTGVTTAPVYADAQAVIEHDISERTTARLSFFGGDDRLALVLASPSAQDPGFGGDFGARVTFARVQGRVDSRISDGVRLANMVSWGTHSESFRGGADRVETMLHLVQARSELRARVTRGLTAIVGADVLWGTYDVRLRIPPAAQLEAEPAGPLFGTPSRRLVGSGGLSRPAGYAQLEITPLPGLVLLPGVRVDATSDTKHTTVDPRGAARWDVVRGEHRTTLKGGLGVYHQPPLQEGLEPWGTAGLRNMRALHASAGIEQQITSTVDVSIEAFAKEMDDLLVTRAAETTRAGGVVYENTGTGTARGVELLARVKPAGRFSGWLAYTLSRSERRDAPGEASYLFAYDQTHVLSALGSVDLGRGWTLGSRFRYVTGSPVTPYLGGVVDLDAGAYQPVPSARASARLPDFHRLDVRLEKAWRIGEARIAAYLDVQNVTNAKNPEGLVYRYDYARSERASGLPVLPILGLRGEL